MPHPPKPPPPLTGRPRRTKQDPDPPLLLPARLTGRCLRRLSLPWPRSQIHLLGAWRRPPRPPAPRTRREGGHRGGDVGSIPSAVPWASNRLPGGARWVGATRNWRQSGAVLGGGAAGACGGRAEPNSAAARGDGGGEGRGRRTSLATARDAIPACTRSSLVPTKQMWHPCSASSSTFLIHLFCKHSKDALRGAGPGKRNRWGPGKRARAAATRCRGGLSTAPAARALHRTCP
eukprot:scaffold18424_cov119-Isochrysis_galbana.AAC.2